MMFNSTMWIQVFSTDRKKPAERDCAGYDLATLLTRPGLIALTPIRRCLRSVVQVRAKERMEAFVAL
jgi:hypothetical protein